jgi:hypothetical protein
MTGCVPLGAHALRTRCSPRARTLAGSRQARPQPRWRRRLATHPASTIRPRERAHGRGETRVHRAAGPRVAAWAAYVGRCRTPPQRPRSYSPNVLGSSASDALLARTGRDWSRAAASRIDWLRQRSEGVRQGKYKPQRIVLGAGTPIREIHWTSYGGRTATAQGMFAVNDCQPNCASGHVTWEPTSFTVSYVGPCHGRRSYRLISIPVRGIQSFALQDC